MKLSTDRILTTHVGSLPRPPQVVDRLLRKDRNYGHDPAAFDRTMDEAVAQVVERQAKIGIDVVSDGEMSKLGYSTYVQERLTGFEGDSERKVHLDLRDHPGFVESMARMTGRQPIRRARCVAPVEVDDREPLRKDLVRFRTAADGAGVGEAFLNAASPGVIAAFQPNEFYPTHEAYIEAVAEAMKEEYEAIADAGFVLQVDCPDLAMARHTSFQDLTETEFLKRSEMHVEALNHALANVPAESARIHLCWGNYEGPHDHDIALDKIIGIVLKAKPAAILVEAANPRHEHEWTVWRDAGLPDDRILVPGVIDSTTNFVEHPELVAQRICRFADLVGRERIIAGTDCGFGTFAGYGKMDHGISYKKLRAMVEGAEIASERLWH